MNFHTSRQGEKEKYDKILGKPTDLDSIYKLPEYGSLAGSRASVKGDFENARWKMPDEKKIGQCLTFFWWC